MGQIINRILRIAKSRLNDFTVTSDPIAREDAELKRIIDELNKEKQQKEESRHTGEGQNKREQAPPKQNDGPMTIASACKTLGIGPESTVDDIKSAYKQRMKEYHPDRVASLGEELQELARKKTQEFNKAYEFLKKNKGF